MRQTLDTALGQLEALLAQGASLRDTLARLDAMIPRMTTVRVQPGEDVQAAFESLYATGGMLELASGAHPVALVHRPRPDPRLILIRGDGEATLRGFDGRPGSQNVTCETLGFVDPIGSRHINFGVGRSLIDGVWRHTMTTPDQVPSGFIFRRVTGRGPCKHALVLNAADVLIEDSSFTDYYHPGEDSTACAGYNGTRNIVLRRSRFEAASENIIFGGADSASEAMDPQDILIDDCVLQKRQEWLAFRYNMKCLFEIKNARRVTLRGSQLLDCWPQAWPDAPGIVLKAANQEGSNPWARSEDILIERNRISNVGAYLRMNARNDAGQPSGVCRTITIRHNDFAVMHLAGRAVGIAGGPEGLVIDHNTFRENRHSFLEVSGNWPTAIAFTNNIAQHGRYGLRNLNASPLTLTHNAIVRSAEFAEVRLPETNVYYEPGADLSGHVTSDGLPVGA